MLLSFEVPFKNLTLGAAHSDYLFVLPQLYLEHERYRRFVDSYPGQKFLDNGAYELGESMPFDGLIDAMTGVFPDVFVVPDVLGSFEGTIRVAKSFSDRFNRSYFPKTRLMVVAQGKSVDERLRCLFKLKRMIHFDIIGLPRFAAPRLSLFKVVVKRFRKPIHLLGCPDPYEVREIVALNDPLLFSLDTSWVARDALGIGESRKLDFFRDELDESRFFESYRKFLSIVFPKE